MFTIKASINILLCVGLIILLNFFTAKYANSSENFIQENKTSEVLKLLNFENDENEIARKWNEYLYESTRFTNKEYQTAIIVLKEKYNKTYDSANTCISAIGQQCKEESLSWIADLKSKFGTEYIVKNIESIRYVVVALVMSSESDPCTAQIKNTLYEEYRYFDAAKIYVEEFLEFAETLSEEERMILSDKIGIAENYLKNFYYPFQVLWSHDGLREALFLVALKSRGNLDQAVIDYISNHPDFNKHCLPGKALNILNSITK